jgi:uroporphyrinogen-III synthase
VGVINVQHRKQHQHSAREIRLISTVGFLVGAEIELARIESQKAALESQLETRKALERAKGILQRELKIDEEAAYLALQKESRQRRKTIREIAEALILSDEFRRRAK